jgi:hypothetical protein
MKFTQSLVFIAVIASAALANASDKVVATYRFGTPKAGSVYDGYIIDTKVVQSEEGSEKGQDTLVTEVTEVKGFSQIVGKTSNSLKLSTLASVELNGNISALADVEIEIQKHEIVCMMFMPAGFLGHDDLSITNANGELVLTHSLQACWLYETTQPKLAYQQENAKELKAQIKALVLNSME